MLVQNVGQKESLVPLVLILVELQQQRFGLSDGRDARGSLESAQEAGKFKFLVYLILGPFSRRHQGWKRELDEEKYTSVYL